MNPTTQKQLLVDCIAFEFSKDQINESIKRNDGKLIVSGILQTAGVKNQNGRVYPKETLMREAANYSENYIKENRALGELDHPDSPIVNLKNVSHNVTEIHWEGDNLMGRIEVLTTPSGNILRELFKSGIRLGISSRALGTVKPLSENTVEVQGDLELVCWDFVSNPSTRGAFVTPINESTNKQLIKNPETQKYQKVEEIILDILMEIK